MQSGATQARVEGSDTLDALHIRGLTKGFGGTTVLSGLDLDIAAGSLIGVIGPNGSGKSTLFGLVAGQLRPDAGTISLLGNDITGMPAAARARAGIGRCFQVPQTFGSLSVFENAYVAAAFARGLPPHEAEELALATLLRTGFGGKELDLADSLSLLDRKRLELARALATGPRLLLLDEIAGGLTDDEAFALADLVAELRDEGITIIWVEHLMHVLTRSVDRIVVLGDGRIVADGTPKETLADPEVRRLYLGQEDEAADV